MTINDEHRQLDLVREAEEALRTLAHSTRNVPQAQESYALLGVLADLIHHTSQVCDQLAGWHNRAVPGKHYTGETNGHVVDSSIAVAGDLSLATKALRAASSHVHQAHQRSSLISWHDATPGGPSNV